MKRTILISNDDGYHAVGINVLAETLSKAFDVVVVAPAGDSSGASSSLTLRHPIRYHQLAPNRILAEGTPADCVHASLRGLLKEEPSCVVSGINIGANLGDDAIYSGTIAAAIEGRILDRPPIAISLCGETHFDTAAKVALKLLEHPAQDYIPGRTVLNVNVPDVPFEALKGMEVTRLGRRKPSHPIIPLTDPRGKSCFWLGPVDKPEDDAIGTDFHAIEHKKVSITPLHIDMTRYDAFDAAAQWLSDMDSI